SGSAFTIVLLPPAARADPATTSAMASAAATPTVFMAFSSGGARPEREGTVGEYARRVNRTVRPGTCQAFVGSVRSTTLNVLLSNVCPRRSARFLARTSGTALANAISSRASRDTRSQSGNRGRAGPHARSARCGQPPRARLLSPVWLREAVGRRPPHQCLPRDAVHRRLRRARRRRRRRDRLADQRFGAPAALRRALERRPRRLPRDGSSTRRG